jgi:predicted nucleic acid-binding protein
MSTRSGLVLDANILIRAVFGKRVGAILERYDDRCDFYTPEVCVRDARKYIPELCKKRKLDSALALSALGHIEKLVKSVDRGLYSDFEPEARERVQLRDPEDWPVVAVALLRDCPVWTEDRDFFGAGLATWTTSTVELYLRKTKGSQKK